MTTSSSSGSRMRLRDKYPIPARLNIVLTAIQVLLSLSLLFWASHADNIWWIFVAAILFSYLMQMGFSLMHEAEHNKLHPNRRINDGMGFILAAMFPASYQLMKVGHLNHHKVNRSDAELVDYFKPGESRWLKTIQYYALIHGLIWLVAPILTLIICLIPSSLLRTFFNQAEHSVINRYLSFIQKIGPSRVRLETVGAIVLWWAFISVGDISMEALLWCYAAFGFSWSSQQYVYHVRTPRHLIEGAYDLKLTPALKWLYLKFNYHRAHHRAVNVPWIYMDQLSDEQPSRPYLNTYLKLWGPPQAIDQAFPQDLQMKGPLPLAPAT